MTIRFPCPHCGAVFNVPDRAAGRQGRCAKCNARIIVPEESCLKPSEQEVDPAKVESDGKSAAKEKDRGLSKAKIVIISSSTLLMLIVVLGIGLLKLGNGEPVLEIVSIQRSSGRGIFNQIEPKVVAEIRNNSGRSVNLFLGHVSGKKYMILEQIEWERENTPGFKMPYGIGCEVLWRGSEQWQAPFTSYAWTPSDRKRANKYEAIREITIYPHTTVSCSILLSNLHSEGTTNVRVFLLDPDYNRIEEKTATFQL
jgi:predicted Zn finger-like uncharacterized protein